MRCGSAVVTGARAVGAASEVVETLLAQLRKILGGIPAWTILSHDAGIDGEALRAAWKARVPLAALHRLSSCYALLTERGVHPRPVVVAFGILDDEGSFGVASCELKSGEGDTALGVRVAETLDQAMSRAGRRGEAPELLFISTVPGFEEAVLRVVEAELGPVPVAGGSAADDTIDGQWSVGDDQASFASGVVISAMYPRHRPSMAFGSGYVPAGPSGRITSTQGRVVAQIDGQAAAEVYDRWTGGALRAARETISKNPSLGSVSVLAASSLSPVGRRVAGGDHDRPRYVLSHPEAIFSDGSLSFFTELHVGDRIELMHGSVESLVGRAPRVVQAALESQTSSRPVAGGILVYCAGCMLAVGDRIEEIPPAVEARLGAPFLGMFTFGEQGCPVDRENLHGNLMVSMVVFHD